MAQVTIRLNGYSYVVGCQDGQEKHLQAMAQQVERRVERVRAMGGQSGEGRVLALAALLMADEIHDLAAEKLDSGTAAALADGERARNVVRRQAQVLAGLAERAEAIAAALERD